MLESRYSGIRALLFDVDGVLIDSMPSHLIAFHEVLRPYHISLELNEVAGRKTSEVFSRLAREGAIPIDVIGSLAEEKSRLAQQLLQSVGIDRNLVDRIESLRHSFVLGLCTSGGRHTLDNLFAKGLKREWFCCALSASDVARAKPDPEIFVKASLEVSVPPHECLVIEDSQSGIQAATSAGCRVVAIGNQFAKAWGDSAPPSFPSTLDFVIDLLDIC